MAFEHARNQVDALRSQTFALPNAASGSTQATGLDLGAETFKSGEYEVELSVPALTTTMVPDTRTVTYIVETSTTSNFSAIDQTLYSEVFTASGGAGIAAKRKRVRVPSNCARYVRGKVTLGASTTDSSTITATFQQVF